MRPVLASTTAIRHNQLSATRGGPDERQGQQWPKDTIVYTREALEIKVMEHGRLVTWQVPRHTSCRVGRFVNSRVRLSLIFQSSPLDTDFFAQSREISKPKETVHTRHLSSLFYNVSFKVARDSVRETPCNTACQLADLELLDPGSQELRAYLANLTPRPERIVDWA